MSRKPPLGIEPTWSWLEARILGLQNAITGYIRPNADEVVPSDISVTFEWADELKLRLQELHKLRLRL